jgi:hypothetical protein
MSDQAQLLVMILIPIVLLAVEHWVLLRKV